MYSLTQNVLQVLIWIEIEASYKPSDGRKSTTACTRLFAIRTGLKDKAWLSK